MKLRIPISLLLAVICLMMPYALIAGPGMVDPSDTVISDTYGVYQFSGLVFDDKAKRAIVLYESCANNGTICDTPLVYTGFLVTITITETACAMRKGTAAEVTCDNASYFLSNLEADIDTDSKGLKAGCDAAFTAGYGT